MTDKAPDVIRGGFAINTDELKVACDEWLSSPFKVKYGKGIRLHPYVIRELVSRSEQRNDLQSKLSASEAKCERLEKIVNGSTKERLLAKFQPCGCVICHCDDYQRCRGCGAKMCGTHPVDELPNPVFIDEALRDCGEGE